MIHAGLVLVEERVLKPGRSSDLLELSAQIDALGQMVQVLAITNLELAEMDLHTEQMEREQLAVTAAQLPASSRPAKTPKLLRLRWPRPSGRLSREITGSSHRLRQP